MKEGYHGEILEREKERSDERVGGSGENIL